MKAEEAIAVNDELGSLTRKIHSLEWQLKALKDMRENPSEDERLVAHDSSYNYNREKPEPKKRIDAVLAEMRYDIIRAAELGVERDLRILKNRRRVVKMAFDNYFDDEKAGN